MNLADTYSDGQRPSPDGRHDMRGIIFIAVRLLEMGGLAIGSMDADTCPEPPGLLSLLPEALLCCQEGIEGDVFV